MNPKYTPAPWVLDGSDHAAFHGRAVIRHNGVTVCAMLRQTTMTAETFQANAALIVSAPGLASEVIGLTKERDVARTACVNLTAMRDHLSEEVDALRISLRIARKERDDLRDTLLVAKRSTYELVECIAWHDAGDFAKDPDSETYRRIARARAVFAS